MDPQVLKALGLKANTAIVDFFEVTDSSAGGTAAPAARLYLEQHPQEEVFKIFLPKRYRLVLEQGNLYWKVPEPAAKLIPLTRGDVVDPKGPGLDESFRWFVVECRN